MGSFPSNSIGSFAIGVSPIGDTDVFDWTETVLSQYANSPTLYQWLTNIAGYYDFTQNYDNFFDFIWNVDSAQGYGLDIWGRIVGVSRVLTLPTGGKYFGFKEAGNFSADPWNQSPFYNGVAVTGNFVLADAPFRLMVLAKALANICDGFIPSLNQILLLLFPQRGNIYVTDGNDMTMTITSAFVLSDIEVAVIEKVFPTPAGVSLSLILP